MLCTYIDEDILEDNHDQPDKVHLGLVVVINVKFC